MLQATKHYNVPLRELSINLITSNSVNGADLDFVWYSEEFMSRKFEMARCRFQVDAKVTIY